MDIAEVFKEAIVVGGSGAVGVWAVYSIVRKLYNENKQREAIDTANTDTIKSLRQMHVESQEVIRNERDRADAYAKKLQEFSEVMGQTKAELKHAQEHRDALTLEVVDFKQTIAQLVEENRNKDRSINELVDMNRKLLRVLSPRPAIPNGIPGETT